MSVEIPPDIGDGENYDDIDGDYDKDSEEYDEDEEAHLEDHKEEEGEEEEYEPVVPHMDVNVPFLKDCG